MVELAAEQAGFLGVESVREALGDNSFILGKPRSYQPLEKERRA